MAEAGFGSYVKIYKPWFIGREAFMAREKTRKGVVARFRFTEKGVRMAHHGDPVLDKQRQGDRRGDQLRGRQRRLPDRPGTLWNVQTSDRRHPHCDLPGRAKEAGKAPAELNLGDRVNLAHTGHDRQPVSKIMKQFVCGCIPAPADFQLNRNEQSYNLEVECKHPGITVTLNAPNG